MLFISHRTADKNFAVDLKQRALDQGYSNEQLFLDSDPDAGIRPGDDWQQTLYSSLRKSRAMIVLCSPNWLKSHWCFVELGYAKATAMGIFPIMIEKCDLDGTLSPSQVIDMIPASMTDQVREAAFDRLWRTLRDQHLGPKDIPYWPPDKCPFPGLMAFNEEYAPVYFGRETERDQVLRVLNQMRDQGVPRLLMITGGSGSGKSSLVRAGVLPWLNHALEANRWLTLPTFRFNETSEQHTLLGRLAESLVAHFPPDVRPDWKRLRDLFDSEEIAHVAQSFADTVRDLNQTCNLVERTLVVVIDQFEELLSNQSRPSHLRFLQFVQKLLSGSDGRILMIGTLRSDYLDVYERHPLALQPPYFHTYRVPPFPKERVNDVIVQPAARVGVVFSNELLERLRIDFQNTDALPLLAFTLEKLFHEVASDGRIELDEYERLGGMTGAVEQAVQRIMNSQLSTEIEHALRTSFVRHLVQVNEKDEFIRRSALLMDLPALARPIIEKFISERLLHTTGEGESTSVEVTHEAIFRCWPTLIDWLKVSSGVLRWRRNVQRDRQLAGSAWTGLTKAQLAVSRHWVVEIPQELNANESSWIRSALRLERTVRATIFATISLISVLLIAATTLAFIAWNQQQNAIQSKQATFAALTNNLKMFNQPTELAGKIAAAVTARQKAEALEALRQLTDGASLSATSSELLKKLEDIKTTIKEWKEEEPQHWDTEKEPSTEEVRQAVLAFASGLRSAWDAQLQLGLSEPDQDFTRQMLLEPKYKLATGVTQAIANGSRNSKDLDTFERLYWSELVFLETKEVETQMIRFRRTLRGHPEYSHYDLRDLVKELNAECDRAMQPDSKVTKQAL